MGSDDTKKQMGPSRINRCFPSLKGRIKTMMTRYGMLKLISLLSAVYIAFLSYAPVGTFTFPDGVSFGGFVTRRDNPQTPDNPKGFPAWQDQSGMWLPGYVLDVAYPTGRDDDPYGGGQGRTEAGVILTRGSLRTIVANTNLGMFCLGVTRLSAFLMYPSLVLVFTTKFRATSEIIMQSSLGMFTYDDLHELHVFCGWVVVVDGIIHTLFHIIRFAEQGTMNLLVDHRTGTSGICITICIILIGFPMMFEALRKRVAYEIRKYLHYLFVVFCIAMSFHAPLSTIPNGGFTAIIFPAILLWWALDNLYVYLFMTEKIETTRFDVVATGVQLTMSVSERFRRRVNSGGYCYVNFPWISKSQWHAFSLFENPSDPSQRQIYIQDLGDWTHSVRQALQRDTRRPVWVMGPFSSPYDSAVDNDNQILVAGGIGITPAISVMRKHADSRRSNLIWAVRDPFMLEFFVKHGAFSTRGWNLVFYTGKQPLYVGSTSEIVTSTGALLHIVRARPNLGHLIPNIIYSIESGKFVPETFVSQAKADAICDLQEELMELDESDMTEHEKVNELVIFCDSLGFLFTDLMGEIAKDDANMLERMKTIEESVSTSTSQSSGSSINPSFKRTSHSYSTSKADPSPKRDVENQEEEKGTENPKTDEDVMLAAIRQVPLGIIEDDEQATRMTLAAMGGGVMRREAMRRQSNLRSMGGGDMCRQSSLRSMGRGAMCRQSSLRSMGGGAVRRQSSGWDTLKRVSSNYAVEEVNSYMPWKEDSKKSRMFVGKLDQDMVMDTWGCLYCGGQGPLANALKETSKELGISVALESFKW